MASSTTTGCRLAPPPMTMGSTTSLQMEPCPTWGGHEGRPAIKRVGASVEAGCGGRPSQKVGQRDSRASRREGRPPRGGLGHIQAWHTVVSGPKKATAIVAGPKDGSSAVSGIGKQTAVNMPTAGARGSGVGACVR
eukprot:3634865-Prymnesium_polylepis.1